MSSCLYPQEAFIDTFSTNGKGKYAKPIFDRRYLASADWCLADNGAFVSARYQRIELSGCRKELGHLCVNCRKARAWEITVRALAEQQSLPPFTASSFITLTVDDKYLDDVFPHGFLRHSPWQKFAKRLAKRIGPFRFLMCGEYGEKSHRPHYHAIIFGKDLRDSTLCRSARSSSIFGSVPALHYGTYRSDGTYCSSSILESAWPYGLFDCRPVSDGAIAYVAGYQLKLDDAGWFDEPPASDEMDLFQDSYYQAYHSSETKRFNYVRWSRVPGLGYKFLCDNYKSIFSETVDTCDDGFAVRSISPTLIFKGKPIHFDGRYFKNKLSLISPDLFDKMSFVNRQRQVVAPVHNKFDPELRMKNLKKKADVAERRLADKIRDLD